MPRCTAEEVRAIKPASPGGISEITPFIAVANNLINQVALNGTYTDEILKLAETFLSAHFLCGVEQEKESEKLEGWGASYKSLSSLKGALNTSYGISANQLLNGALENQTMQKSTFDIG